MFGYVEQGQHSSPLLCASLNRRIVFREPQQISDSEAFEWKLLRQQNSESTLLCGSRSSS